jgi:catechol 2,3-dioxygenase-like lactoylglutathione lyase family enzyme
MAAKVHVHMHVSDLVKSREFYRAFFGTAPVKEKPGYAKFLPAWGPVNLALSQGGGPGSGPVDHLGVQVESTAEVMAQLSRIKAAGLPVREEMGVNCCHANQDKFCVKDPDGVEWEVYYLNYDLEDEVAVAPGRVEQIGGLSLAKTMSCCGPSSGRPLTRRTFGCGS